VVSNIAEGFESQTQRTFIDYLGRAKASAGELRAQLYLTLDRQYLGEDEFEQASVETQIFSCQIVSLSRCLESKPNSRRVRDEGASYNV
jgi:four helix bundle protein